MSETVIDTKGGDFADNLTAKINERDGAGVPLDQWAHLHVEWFTSHPECYRDPAIVRRMQDDFDPMFRPVVVKHVWRRPGGGIEPRFYHVFARLINGDVHSKLGDPITFTDQVPEDYRGNIYDWITLCSKPAINDGRPDEFVPFDERTYALLRDTTKDYQTQSAKQVFLAQRRAVEDAKIALIAQLAKEGEYRMNHDGRYAKRALISDLVGHEDQTVWHKPSKVMQGTEYPHPSGLVLVKS